MAQKVEQISVGHVLGDDIIRRLPGTNAQQLHQIGMLHLFHDGGLGQKVLQTHVLLFEGLHRNYFIVAEPDAFVNITVLTTAQFSAHLYFAAIQLPFVGSVIQHVRWAKRVELWFVPLFGRRIQQSSSQAVSFARVMMYKLGETREFGLFAYVEIGEESCVFVLRLV